jgi:hypothetical protein
MKWVRKKLICSPKRAKNGYTLTFLEIYPRRRFKSYKLKKKNYSYIYIEYRATGAGGMVIVSEFFHNL